MSSFPGKKVDTEDAEAQLKSLTEIQRFILKGIDPDTLNLVVINDQDAGDNDYVIDTNGNLIRWE